MRRANGIVCVACLTEAELASLRERERLRALTPERTERLERLIERLEGERVPVAGRATASADTSNT